jgi:glucose-1-phosphate cytidylyltransferase
MKVVILAGGLGTRISEETVFKPKPMVLIGDKPILWHIMKIYSSYGFNDFVICCGYKGHVIKEYFANYLLHESDVTINTATNNLTFHNSTSENWNVSLINTGELTMTGGRIKRIQEYVGNETFFLTYGDGVGDINIEELLAFHKSQGKKATLTATKPFGRFGVIDIANNGQITSFKEKDKQDVSWINGGFFVLEPSVFDYIEGDSTVFEKEPLEKLTQEGELNAFKHDGFWRAMDSLNDKNVLEEYWNTGTAAWKVW